MPDLIGTKTRDLLERGLSRFRGGQAYALRAVESAKLGFQRPMQLIVDRAEGDFVYDLEGREIIDFQNGWATNPLGNCHPEIIEVVQAAQKRYGFHWEHPLRVPVAEAIAGTMPEGALPRFSFEVSGTEAVESAVHAALCHTGRRTIIAFASSFHGEGLGTKLISAYNSDNYVGLEAWSGGVIRAPFPHSSVLPPGLNHAQYQDYCLWYLEQYIPKHVMAADNIAAVLIEPALAEGGNWIPDPTFLQEIRGICDRQDWLMIADEVLTGVGRTGRFWAVEHAGITPDLMVVGKHLSGGIEAFAGFAARDDILGNNPKATGGSTFAGTPAGCAAALKTLEIIERDDVLSHAQRLANIAEVSMADWAARYDIVSEVRGLGLLLGVGFGQDEETGVLLARSVRDEMLKRGVWALCDFEPQVRLYPALTMSPEVLKAGLARMEEAIAAVSSSGPTIGDYPAMPNGNVGF
ncbi:MAG: aspartate aminotransferase family protein [Pseudomonadales bacterium]